MLRRANLARASATSVARWRIALRLLRPTALRSEHSERLEAWPPFETPPSAAPQGEVLSQTRREVHAVASRGPMNTGPAIVGHRSRGHDARRAGRRKRDYQITRRHPRGRAAQ